MNNLIIPDKKLIQLDHTISGPMAAQFYDFIKTRAVGQPRIFKWCAETVEAILQGFYPERGPAASVLLVGPSGVGKTYIVKILAEFLFGDPDGFMRVDGQDLSLEHNIARLIGAPAGYVGYGDEPMITQEKLDRPGFQSAMRWFLHQSGAKVQKEYFQIQQEQSGLMRHLADLSRMPKPDAEKQKAAQEKLDALAQRLKALGVPGYDPSRYIYTSLLLLDEIERAHHSFHNILLRLLDEGKLPLAAKPKNGGSGMLDFRRTIIVATSNLGSEEITKLLRISSGRSAGYRFAGETYTPEQIDWTIYRTCRNAVDKFFPTELVNRFGDVIAARPHSRANLFEILDIEINKLAARFSDGGDLGFSITLCVDPAVKEYLVGEAAEHPEKGIRYLQQKLNTRIFRVISTLKSSEQLHEGDILHVSFDPASKKLLFHKEAPTPAGKPTEAALFN